MTEILPKPIKLPKYPINLKNDQNTPKPNKMTEIPSNPKNYQITS